MIIMSYRIYLLIDQWLLAFPWGWYFLPCWRSWESFISFLSFGLGFGLPTTVKPSSYNLWISSFPKFLPFYSEELSLSSSCYWFDSFGWYFGLYLGLPSSFGSRGSRGPLYCPLGFWGLYLGGYLLALTSFFEGYGIGVGSAYTVTWVDGIVYDFSSAFSSTFLTSLVSTFTS